MPRKPGLAKPAEGREAQVMWLHWGSSRAAGSWKVEKDSQPPAAEPGMMPTVPGPRHPAASSTASFLGLAGSVLSPGFAVQLSVTIREDPDPKHE